MKTAFNIFIENLDSLFWDPKTKKFDSDDPIHIEPDVAKQEYACAFAVDGNAVLLVRPFLFLDDFARDLGEAKFEITELEVWD